MLIKNIFKQKRPVISFEIFPPKKDGSIDTIYDTIEALKDLKPDFISVTYGAGGSSRDKTIEIASIIKNKYYIEALAHLTCVALTEEKLKDFIVDLKSNNVHNIMALRGDLPEGYSEGLFHKGSYKYASDLINKISSDATISVGGACYPEGHIESSCIEEDIEQLKRKVDSGADFLVTQLFFDNELFYKFKDLSSKKGINIPISAGIMPVTNKKQIERMISLSGASLPSKFTRIMAKYENNPQALKEAGIVYATEQIVDLLSWGIDGIHLYTMNRPETCRRIIQNISSIRNALENPLEQTG
jgi:methylenetetrahydrofolate reductase (NADPH)